MVAGQVRAEDGKGKAPSLELLSRLRYKSLVLGGAEIRLGMNSNEVLNALAKANLHGAWMITGPHTPRIRQYTVAGTNSIGELGTATVAAGFARGQLKGHVYFRDDVCICINKVVASFRDDDRGTEFARRLIELLWTAQREPGTQRIVSGQPSIIGEEITFDVVPGNKRISCSATGGKFLLNGEVKDSFAPSQAEINESIYCLDSMSEINTLLGLREFWGMRDE